MNDITTLQTSLQQLRRDIESGQPLDPALRAQLLALDADIHRLIERSASQSAGAASPEAAPGDESLADRAQSVSAKLAADHPYLESALRDLIDKLGKIGI